MKKYIVVFALLAGVALGLSVVSQSFMLSVDEGTSGDLTPGVLVAQFPGYVPLSLTPTYVQSAHSNEAGKLSRTSPSGSGTYLNTTVTYVDSTYQYFGCWYVVPTRVLAGSVVTVTISSSSSCFELRNLYGSVSSFSVLSQLSSVPLSPLNELAPSVNLFVSDNTFTAEYAYTYYSFGSTFTLECTIPDNLNSLSVVFYRNFPPVSPSGTLSWSIDTSLITIDIDITPPASSSDSWLPLIHEQLVDNGQYIQHISVNSDTIVQYLQDLSIASGTPSEMQKFEDAYLKAQSEQLDKIEQMLSSENSALPNDGDIAGFASDIQDGLGVNGTSFDASAFNDAVSAFSGEAATAAGGPWEFFTQQVADSLSGDAQPVGLNDDDYIYAWLEMMEGRYGTWASSSP